MTPEQTHELDQLLDTLEASIAGGAGGDQCGGPAIIRDAIHCFVSSLTAPAWSSEVPTVAGDYRWRMNERNVYYIFRRVESGTNCYFVHQHGTRLYVEDIGGQWSGPIPEPPA